MKTPIVLVFVLVGIPSAKAAETPTGTAPSETTAPADDTRGLLGDVMLHPMDGFTAYTLPAGQFIYAQSIFTLPLPSWAWWGITDWLTAEIDLLPLIGGFFVPPHLPVPSFNFRFRLLDGGRTRPSIAFETMVQHMWLPFKQEDNERFFIERDGTSWFNRINISWPVTPRFMIHASLGATWAHSIRYESRVEPERSVLYVNSISPDASLSLDWRIAPWVSAHITGSYGTTFVYSDNQPRKLELLYGFRFAPFFWMRCPVLRTMRLEIPGIVIHHPSIGQGFESYIPLLPYFYWQFGGETDPQRMPPPRK